jgi:NAD(P)-dependent dehydrogenase (short-subunit alcohol dehydrogenase family)
MSIDPLFDVDRRVVVVTGGMGQLGRRFSQALRQRGARVVVLDVAMDDATVAQRYGHDHDGFLFVKGDVTSGTSLQTALVTIENAWGVPHALINNAAIDAPPDAPPQENGPFETYPEASWRRDGPRRPRLDRQHRLDLWHRLAGPTHLRPSSTGG